MIDKGMSLNNFAYIKACKISRLNKWLNIDASYWQDTESIEIEVQVINEGNILMSRFASYSVESLDINQLSEQFDEEVIKAVNGLISDLKDEKDILPKKNLKSLYNRIISSLECFKIEEGE